ncbi:hypothetical protein [Mesorhizobium sp. M2A.F.Ca.ET.039.01.1.1]|nr:hypothetical protein [Mesorhizobium sp. M2A.F.Ca.ET.039.01.1.1]
MADYTEAFVGIDVALALLRVTGNRIQCSVEEKSVQADSGAV